MEGVIVKSTGSWYDVRDNEGVLYRCRLKGKFKIKGLKVTNPIAVGDHVLVELENQHGTGVIYDIRPRQNYLIRSSAKHPEIGNILASNIDQAILIATLVRPKTSLGFIDRYLVSAETFRIPVVLVFNKVDIYNDHQMEELNVTVQLYRSIGYTSLITSFTENTGLVELSAHLGHKISLLSGHSGVGKSTLLNLLIPGGKAKY